MRVNLLQFVTAPFNNMRTLKFKAQPTNACFATINQMFGNSLQLPTVAEHCFVVRTVFNDLISARSASSRREAGRVLVDLNSPGTGHPFNKHSYKRG